MSESGARAERRSLESIAEPITVAEAEGEREMDGGQPGEHATRRTERERRGLRRYRPGPGTGYEFFSPGMVGTAGATRRAAEGRCLDHEIEAIGRAVDERGPLRRDELARLLGARFWGPGRFGTALAEATQEGRVRRLRDATYAPPDRGRRVAGADRTRGIPGASRGQRFAAAAGHPSGGAAVERRRAGRPGRTPAQPRLKGGKGGFRAQGQSPACEGMPFSRNVAASWARHPDESWSS